MSDAAELALIDQRVNEGVTDVLLRTDCKVISGTLTETSGTGDYTLDSSILRVVGWSWTSSGTVYTPDRVSVVEMLRLRQNNSTTGGTPSAWAQAGANLLMVYPSPTAADTITIYYVPEPVVLSAAADTPSEIPDWGHPAVEKYALAALASYDDDASSAQGQRYRDDYEFWVQKIRRHLLLKGGPLPRAKVNRSGARVGRHDNSQYP